ncbi:hypothetical protein GCM10011340_34060 [Roseivirga thermotolerans]|uniref:SMODS and SLOG-associating 2TM effector domain-containing protein n=2 Tax=Roseivirga thermotolerans TaxID=1758176 RepID=A0ABQ3I9N2_9BACT|nr:hypothetical protein GCM10011340_34060 [Roseivirga thermotolerans]
MLDMHSFERDRFKRKSLLLDILIILFTVVLNSFVFTDYSFLGAFGIERDAQVFQVIVQLSGVLLFASSIVLMIVNWKGKASDHENATKKLFLLKVKLEEAHSKRDESLIDKFLLEYKKTMDSIVPIANNRFNRLKSRHLRKVGLSKYISDNPNKPFWKAKFDFWINSLKKNDKKD